MKDAVEIKKLIHPTPEEVQGCLRAVIKHLNIKANKRHGTKSKTTQKLIKDLLERGFTKSDMILVINFKVLKWGHLPSFRGKISPVGLFSFYCFSIYLKEAKNFYNSQ